MRFADYYNGNTKPVVSLEVYPPRTAKAEENFVRVLPRLIDLKPDYMTVTYGAMGSTREKSISTAIRIKNEFGIECASHLTCVGATREALEAIIRELYQGGIRNIVALRGDIPPEDGEPVTIELEYGRELVEMIRELGLEQNEDPVGIAVAGYPDKHIEAHDLASDLRYLKQKVDAGADIIVTQLFYNNDTFFYFVEQCRALGITAPIIPGLLPIVSFKQILKITSMCGVHLPERLRSELEAAQDDPKAMTRIGIDYCVRQVEDLGRRGVPGIHFYVLNRSDHIRQILERTGLR